MTEKPGEKGDAMSIADPRRFSMKSNRSISSDEESMQEEKIPYPKHVFFIFGNEFCERFAYYGMKTVLTLYLTTKLMFDEDTATAIYTTFSSLCYFTSIFGAILSDSYLGKFKTIFYVSIVYACGSIMLAIGSLNIKGDVPISLIALLVIAFGTGGIKPCVSAFGGDQFKLPQQAQQMVQFFAIFYFSINFGSFLSTIITPILRSDVSCFGQESCFFAAFGVPAVLFVIAIAVFFLGRNKYTITPPTGENLLVKCCSCVGNAISQKRKLKKEGDTREHWLNYSEEKYGAEFVDDVKALLNVLVLYLPLPIFFTLYDQTGSTWLFQSTRMNGRLGGITLKADQMQAVNAILILMFIPFFDQVVYPVAAKINCLTKPLRRMGWGMILCACAFVLSGGMELIIEDTYPVLPKEGKSHLSFVNGAGCEISIKSSDLHHDDAFTMKAFEEKTFTELTASNVEFSLDLDIATCKGDFQPKESVKDLVKSFSTKKETAASIFIYVDPDTKELSVKKMDNDEKDKDNEGLVKMRVYYNIPQSVRDDYKEVFFECEKRKGDETVELEDDKTGNTEYTSLDPFKYTISLVNGKHHITSKDEPTFDMGGVYNVLVQQMDEEKELKVDVVTLTTPSSYHMLLQVPQYAVLTAGEMLFSITGLEFSYAQAPPSMKCVVQSCWLLTTAIGDVILIFIEQAHMKSRASQFFLYAGIMVADTIIFAYLGYRYKPYQSKIHKEEDENEPEEMKEKSNSIKKEDEGFDE